MSSLTKKGKKLSTITRLQQDINAGHTLEEAYILPKNIINANSHTIKEKTRLLR
jgi:hypothetical protein